MHLFPLIIVATVGRVKRREVFRGDPALSIPRMFAKPPLYSPVLGVQDEARRSATCQDKPAERPTHHSSQRCRCASSGAVDRVGVKHWSTSMDLWEPVLLDMHPH